MSAADHIFQGGHLTVSAPNIQPHMYGLIEATLKRQERAGKKKDPLPKLDSLAWTGGSHLQSNIQKRQQRRR